MRRQPVIQIPWGDRVRTRQDSLCTGLVLARPAQDNTPEWLVVRGDEGRFRHLRPASPDIHLLDVSPTEIMWSVEDIELIPVELDFSSSGQGRRAATAITAEGVRLTNAIELVDVTPAATQVEVCECCGFSHCSPGGWVTFRRIGQNVVWLPAWEEMEKGAWEGSEYRPPTFLATKGAPVFGRATWERLRALHEGLPACEEIPGINSREVARLCQWTAPGRVLGEYPAVPRVRRDLVIAVTDGDLSAEIGAVDQILQEHYGASAPMHLIENAAAKPIEFWLDLQGTPAWKCFAHVENHVCCLLNEAAALVYEMAC